MGCFQGTQERVRNSRGKEPSVLEPLKVCISFRSRPQLDILERRWYPPEKLHGPPMSVDKAGFGLVLYNHAYFYRFEETSTYWSVKRISVFFCFSFVNQRHTSCIIVYNRTMTNVENTVRAVHSCNSWLNKKSQKLYRFNHK